MKPWNVKTISGSAGGVSGAAIVTLEVRTEAPTVESVRQLADAAPALLRALEDLRKELREHVKFNVKKHYSLMVADVCADKAIRKAKGEQ